MPLQSPSPRAVGVKLRGLALRVGLAACALAVALTPRPADASVTISGTEIQIYYGPYGVWNNPSSSYGFQSKFGGSSFVDVTYPGTPWALLAVEYTKSGSNVHYYALQRSSATVNMTLSSETDLSTSTTKEVEHVWSAGDLTITRNESWDISDNILLSYFELENSGSTTISNIRLLYAIDPDQDSWTLGTSSTYNDVRDVDGDGTDDWVESAGYYSGQTIGFGACDPANSDLGHWSSWGSTTDADQTMSDPGGSGGDWALGLRWNYTGSVTSGDVIDTSIVVITSSTASGARTDWTTAASTICTTTDPCDVDGDGYDDNSSTCGGTDCDDSDRTVNPGATEIAYDGVDQDCDGADLTDVDGDGIDGPSAYATGVDCDDYEATTYPGATDTWYDGADSDCGGEDDYDADADGYVPTGYGGLATTNVTGSGALPDGDCDDTDSSVNPGEVEVPYDGIDQDCSGADLDDQDGDGYAGTAASGGTDCDDFDADTHPGATETADGTDEDCDGTVDDGTSWYDDDGDGYTEAGGDCDDSDASSFPGATETADGIDEDCDGTVDEGTTAYDDDGDGYSEDDGDCNDGDIGVSPGASETMGNGIDDDCDGVVDDGVNDGDGDGYASWAGDCDDADATVYPGAPELEDGIDNDCDDETDEGTAASDDDGDGYTEADGDCNDADADVNPGATEHESNGIDDDCDDSVDEGGEYGDDDGDGFTEAGGDCDDADADVNPGASEDPSNGVDDDCDGETDETATVADADGDGFTSAQGDCDDTDGFANPDMTELCDGIDNDCDGEVDEDDCATVEGEGLSEGDKSGCSTAQASTAGWGIGLAFLLAGWRRRDT